jgi:hypothetical protein
MNTYYSLIVLVCATLAVFQIGCRTAVPNPEHSAWKRLVPDSSELAGVIVEQLPEISHSQHLYFGKHPFEVQMVYWDGRIQMFEFTPDGLVRRTAWSEHPLKHGDEWWGRVDFSYGSDPDFSKHSDPRRYGSARR